MLRNAVLMISILFIVSRLLPHLAATEITEPISWYTDYHQAMEAAKQSKRMLLFLFHDENDSKNQSIANIENTITSENDLRPLLQDYVLAKLSCIEKISIDQKEIILLDHAAFAEMQNRPGVAIIDLSDKAGPEYGKVVSVYPLAAHRNLNRWRLRTLLSLPRGSLTQRTIVFAVRTHPDRPRSTRNNFHRVLAGEAESHSLHQANILTQGHHNWQQRFQRMNGRLPLGMSAREVCAESWPGQDLLDSAIECVHSWRQSEGHWQAVSSEQDLFAYDMKRGSNGVWYATGIFASRQP